MRRAHLLPILTLIGVLAAPREGNVAPGPRVAPVAASAAPAALRRDVEQLVDLWVGGVQIGGGDADLLPAARAR